MKAKLIIPALLAVLLISGCSDGSSNLQPIPDQEIEYEQTDVSGVNTVFLKTKDGFVPISYVVDGKSQLSGENYYYNIQTIIDSQKSLYDKKLTCFGSDGKNMGSTTFSDLKENKIKSDPYQMLVTSGNWKLSPTMRYESYDKKDSVGDGYKQFIFESFPEHFSSVSEITVTDIWEYDIDGDGTNDALIRALGDGYAVLAVQSPGLGNKILASCFDDVTQYSIHPFFADIDGDGLYSLITVSGNSFKTACIYKANSLEKDYIIYLPLEK